MTSSPPSGRTTGPLPWTADSTDPLRPPGLPSFSTPMSTIAYPCTHDDGLLWGLSPPLRAAVNADSPTLFWTAAALRTADKFRGNGTIGTLRIHEQTTDAFRFSVLSKRPISNPRRPMGFLCIAEAIYTTSYRQSASLCSRHLFPSIPCVALPLPPRPRSAGHSMDSLVNWVVGAPDPPGGSPTDATAAGLLRHPTPQARPTPPLSISLRAALCQHMAVDRGFPGLQNG